jgi:hypothetical protein
MQRLYIQPVPQSRAERIQDSSTPSGKANSSPAAISNSTSATVNENLNFRGELSALENRDHKYLEIGSIRFIFL